uniref:A kinase (PRKA) anchor protein 11 n=1 Tax=Oryzias latipes TaxID=8090 RepID=A0A3P9JWQ2_ORYLA
MDACARVRGVTLRSRAAARKESACEGRVQSAKSLFRSKKELCTVGLEPTTRAPPAAVTEIHFVALPGPCEGEEVTQKALSSLPAWLSELLRSLHVHSLKIEEVLLLKDPRRPVEHRDGELQSGLKALCVLRLNPSTNIHSQVSLLSLMGLLGGYMGGIRYILELQALQGKTPESSQPEGDDTNQSVSSIEDDFFTALEHLEEDENGEGLSCGHFKKRDVASQTIPSHKRKRELSHARVITSSFSKKTSSKIRPGPDDSVVVETLSSEVEPQWHHCSSGAPLPSYFIQGSESEESNCSSPSPIIFLDDVGYQKSLLAKLEIPQVPGGPREQVEDSDSEVSEFFDSFDQFDDPEELSSDSCTLTLPLDPISGSGTQKETPEIRSGVPVSKYVSRGCSTKVMNLHCFDRPTLPANVKKPTPLKPGSPYTINSEVPDSPRLVQTPSEDNGGLLFSPVSSSAFSPLVESGGPLEYFWKTDGDGQNNGEIHKPRHVCSLYKTYSDFASSLSKEILGSVCGYQSAVDISDNRNLSCVCHKEFSNPSGYLMKLSDMQEMVTVAKLQKKSQSLKDGIQKFASDLVEMSLGSALRDFQKGVSSCTTTLCQLAARLTSSIFQMAFREIGMRHQHVLKQRALDGLAGFLVGEAISGALKEFLTVRKQTFHSIVTKFASDLAEELVFEGLMEVCQFSHTSNLLTPKDWSFGHKPEEKEQKGKVVSSYAFDLSESVIQEAFIELSQANVTFTSQAAISVSLDNICYVSPQSSNTHICSSLANQQVLGPNSTEGSSTEGPTFTVKNALFTVSGTASCIPVPQAGQAISHFQKTEETCQSKFPESSKLSHQRTASTIPHSFSPDSRISITGGDHQSFPLQNFSGNMVDIIVTEACELITASKMSIGDNANVLTNSVGNLKDSISKQENIESHQLAADRQRSKELCSPHLDCHAPPTSFQLGCPDPGRIPSVGNLKCVGGAEPRHVMTDNLDLPSKAGTEHGKISNRLVCCAPGSFLKSGNTPSTPPSTPQQLSEVSTERQIKWFSKTLKSKLAKEFSPATPPPTPRFQHEPGPEAKPNTPEADKAEFMVSLMRSLSEEMDSIEDFEDEDPEDKESVSIPKKCLESENSRHERLSSCRISSNEALHYAKRLACHIVSMATEIDTLEGSEDQNNMKSSERTKDSVAQFSERTLNSLWVYAGEVAGEVINDVKSMVSCGKQCPYHKTHPRRSFERSRSECLLHLNPQPSLSDTEKSRDCRLGRLAEHWSNDLNASVSRFTNTNSSAFSSSSSGLSSEYPSCESVTDEYAGYLIRVLKKEGGSRELVLDQYASRLAYRSIKLGLAHASRKIKQKSSNTRLHSTSSKFKASAHQVFLPKDRKESVCFQTADETLCCCKDLEEQKKRNYTDLVNFAESLAYNITCDVTCKLHVSSVRLPKSFTDSCLYKKSTHEDGTEHRIRNSFSCPVLSKESRSRQYHSTGSLHDVGYSSRVMQVIEHYARKIVDDTLKMSLTSVGLIPREPLKGHGHDRKSHAWRLNERPVGAQELGERTCRYCQLQECPYCTKLTKQHCLPVLQQKRRDTESLATPDRLSSVQIPKIHINLDHRAVFAEEMVSMAMETAKRELSNTSLNADSGISHDGHSYAESLTAEIMTSAMSNACQPSVFSSPGRDVTESTLSQQLSVGDDSLGSWSNLSFEDDHLDDNSSFLHLSDSNGNSSSWSSLGLEGEICEERLSFSPSDSDNGEEKEADLKEESSGTLCVDPPPRAALVVLNSEVTQHRGDPQLRSMLQWAAASVLGVPHIQLLPDGELQQLPGVVQRLRDRRWRVGDLLHSLLRYCEESQGPRPPQPREEEPQDGTGSHQPPLFKWLLEHS